MTAFTLNFPVSKQYTFSAADIRNLCIFYWHYHWVKSRGYSHATTGDYLTNLITGMGFSKNALTSYYAFLREHGYARFESNHYKNTKKIFFTEKADEYYKSVIFTVPLSCMKSAPVQILTHLFKHYFKQGVKVAQKTISKLLGWSLPTISKNIKYPSFKTQKIQVFNKELTTKQGNNTDMNNHRFPMTTDWLPMTETVKGWITIRGVMTVDEFENVRRSRYYKQLIGEFAFKKSIETCLSTGDLLKDNNPGWSSRFAMFLEQSYAANKKIAGLELNNNQQLNKAYDSRREYFGGETSSQYQERMNKGKEEQSPQYKYKSSQRAVERAKTGVMRKTKESEKEFQHSANKALNGIQVTGKLDRENWVRWVDFMYEHTNKVAPKATLEVWAKTLCSLSPEDQVRSVDTSIGAGYKTLYEPRQQQVVSTGKKYATATDAFNDKSLLDF